MKLTHGQVRGALNLSQDALRHWKTVIVPLSIRKGRRPCFSLGDLLALAIIKILTDQLGVPVGNLGVLATALFDQCSQHSWTRFERQAALIDPNTWNLSFVFDAQIPPLTGPAIIIPCAPIIGSLRAALLVEQSDDAQVSLRFPLAAVPLDRRSAGGDNS